MIDKNRMFKEFEWHLMEDERPSIYFNSLIKTGIFTNEYPFTLLGDLIEVEQSPQHHPEGSVWNHTMMVVDHAAQKKYLSEDPKVFMWAALLHDLGKAPTTKIRKGRITAYDHDKAGRKLTIEFLEEFTDNKNFIDKVAALVRWHMQTLFVAKNLPFADIERMVEEVSVEEVGLLSECDRLGRGKMTEDKIKTERKNVEIFIKKSKELINKK